MAQAEGFALEFLKSFPEEKDVMIFEILQSSPKTIINRFLTAGFESLPIKKKPKFNHKS